MLAPPAGTSRVRFLTVHGIYVALQRRHHMHHNHQTKDYSHAWLTDEDKEEDLTSNMKWVRDNPAFRVTMPFFGWWMYLLGVPDGNHWFPNASGRLWNGTATHEYYKCFASVSIVAAAAYTLYFHVFEQNLTNLAYVMPSPRPDPAPLMSLHLRPPYEVTCTRQQINKKHALAKWRVSKHALAKWRVGRCVLGVQVLLRRPAGVLWLVARLRGTPHLRHTQPLSPRLPCFAPSLVCAPPRTHTHTRAHNIQHILTRTPRCCAV